MIGVIFGNIQAEIAGGDAGGAINLLLLCGKVATAVLKCLDCGLGCDKFGW